MHWMAYALSLAESGRYSCPPNPMVGCVIVKDNKLISQGAHLKTGDDHAEVYALRNAGNQAKGADVYLSLEPCSHHGRTPPCVDKLIDAQVKRVHIALSDPNPKVQGQGIAKLRAAGIEVIVGQNHEEAYQLNKVFFHYMHHRLPFVMAKWAMSLDGKIATHNGASQWITSEQARVHAHTIRAEVSGVMVGAGTVIKDDPLLTVRYQAGCRQPRPIIVTQNGTIPLSAKIFTERDDALVITSDCVDRGFIKALEKHRIDYFIVPLEQGKLDLKQALIELAHREVSSVLVEGGSQLLTSFYEKKLINRIYTYIAPKIIGGRASLCPIGGENINCMTQASPVKTQQIISLGDDVCFVCETTQTAQTYEQFLNQAGAWHV